MHPDHADRRIGNGTMNVAPEVIGFDGDPHGRERRLRRQHSRHHGKCHRDEEQRVQQVVETHFARQAAKHPSGRAHDPVPVEDEMNHQNNDESQPHPFVQRDASGIRRGAGDKGEKKQDVRPELEGVGNRQGRGRLGKAGVSRLDGRSVASFPVCTAIGKSRHTATDN